MPDRKISVIGGGGARTPLLVHGLAEAQERLDIRELALYDVDRDRVAIIAELCRDIAGARFAVSTPASLEAAVEGSDFVISSIRVGGIAARARDERICIQHGYAGQETTGPGGLAMALRTIPISLQHARLVESLAPSAWLINFTNPAGLITQALANHTRARVIGICDTPAELFHRIAWSLGEPFESLEFDYFGLNHLGWVRGIRRSNHDLIDRLFESDERLHSLYPGRLFEPDLIRALRLIPTEYLFFYYSQTRAYENQRAAGASRGEEILELNNRLFANLASALSAGRRAEAIEIYKHYLNARNASYMRLESHGESALTQGAHDWNPFEGATGYHRIALDVITALATGAAKRVVVNVLNDSAIPGLLATDVVEVPALIDAHGAAPLAAGVLPSSVAPLVQAVKEYERLAMRAAVECSLECARLALSINPIVGEWDRSVALMNALIESDPGQLRYLR